MCVIRTTGPLESDWEAYAEWYGEVRVVARGTLMECIAAVS